MIRTSRSSRYNCKLSLQSSTGAASRQVRRGGSHGSGARHLGILIPSQSVKDFGYNLKDWYYCELIGRSVKLVFSNIIENKVDFSICTMKSWRRSSTGDAADPSPTMNPIRSNINRELLLCPGGLESQASRRRSQHSRFPHSKRAATNAVQECPSRLEYLRAPKLEIVK